MEQDEKTLFFPAALLLRVLIVRKRPGLAKFACALPAKVAEEMHWRTPDEWESAARKTTRLYCSRLVLKQSRDEIGGHEADIEVKSAEGFEVYRKNGEARVRFVVRFDCPDGAGELEPLIRRTKKPASLRIWYRLKPPAPVQPNLSGVEGTEENAELEETSV